MPSNKANARNVALSESSPSHTVTPLHQPPPPLPVMDASHSPPPATKMSAQKLSQEHQHFPDFEVNQSRIAKETGKDKKEDNRCSSCSSSLTTQYGRTIWSVTPEELTEMAKEIAEEKMKSTDLSNMLSYAEASKRKVPGFTSIRTAQKGKGVVMAHPIRTFKKYYGLPNIPAAGSLNRDAKLSAEKAMPLQLDFCCTETEKKPQNMLDYSQSFGLSPATPTLYPRLTNDKNELVQMLKASLASKKIAPHMDWWPGDWKCTNCGNHNFSYRDTCKRCKVGRQEDAGFVFPSSSTADSSNQRDKCHSRNS